MRGGGLWQLGQSITRRLAQADKKAVARRCFASEAELKKTVLYDFHIANGGKMVPFAGWSMPIQYKDSIMDSTVNCRENGSLFDVSHMCGLSLKGKDCIPFLEKLVIADVAGLAPGTGTLTVFTNEKGGAIDDSVITKVKDNHIYLVVNAGCRDKDLAHIEEHMKAYKSKGGDVSWHIHDERSLLALQVISQRLWIPLRVLVVIYFSPAAILEYFFSVGQSRCSTLLNSIWLYLSNYVACLLIHAFNWCSDSAIIIIDSLSSSVWKRLRSAFYEGYSLVRCFISSLGWAFSLLVLLNSYKIFL